MEYKRVFIQYDVEWLYEDSEVYPVEGKDSHAADETILKMLNDGWRIVSTVPVSKAIIMDSIKLQKEAGNKIILPEKAVTITDGIEVFLTRDSFSQGKYKKEKGVIEDTINSHVNESLVSFTVSRLQSISDVVRNIPGLPTGHASIEIKNSRDNSKIPEFAGWKETGRNIRRNPNAQNIYTYFDNIGSRYSRWREIQDFMKLNNIEEITVTVRSR